MQVNVPTQYICIDNLAKVCVNNNVFEEKKLWLATTFMLRKGKNKIYWICVCCKSFRVGKERKNEAVKLLKHINQAARKMKKKKKTVANFEGRRQ